MLPARSSGISEIPGSARVTEQRQHAGGFRAGNRLDGYTNKDLSTLDLLLLHPGDHLWRVIYA